LTLEAANGRTKPPRGSQSSEPKQEGEIMGMDVFGNNPTSEAGRYFGRNVWGWRPLAELVTELCPEETAACEQWQSNDGDGLDAAESEKLAMRLCGLLESGAVKAYCTNHAARLAKLPDEACLRCKGTGFRVSNPDIPCLQCGGSGKVAAFDRAYSVDEEDVKEFAAFLKACGGFAIC
jgi:hypothetical protein